ncbi:MAG: hypothetical protein ABFD07_00040, partial [Methanobacterium sp.]
ENDIITDCAMSNLIDKHIYDNFKNGAYIYFEYSNGNIVIVNDFMGLIPLYYYQLDNITIICNSFRIIAKLITKIINKNAIYEYLLTGANFSQNTILKNVNLLTPASKLEYSSQTGLLKVFIRDSFASDYESNNGFDSIKETFQILLTSAVQRLYKKDYKYSMSITGGMDSRLIYLEWPDKINLLTETAGEGTSDLLKALDIITEIGNPDLHSIEDLKLEHYTEGIDNYYKNCDNPMTAFDQQNSYHIDWKLSRGSRFHISGAGGELFDGENLYLSRGKKYVIKEAIVPYKYHSINEISKEEMLKNILGVHNKIDNLQFLNEEEINNRVFTNIVSILDPFIGKTKYCECWTERFRTYKYALTGYRLVGSQLLSYYDIVMPYNDIDLIKYICSSHPKHRELRKLTISVLKDYEQLKNIPLDTTHLLISSPYFLHKFFRVLRMVLNIGLHKKIPIIQQGNPPTFRKFPYFEEKYADFRNLVNELILSCDYLDREKVKKYLNIVTNERRYNFYIHHNAETNILLLLRLAYTQKIIEEN